MTTIRVPGAAALVLVIGMALGRTASGDELLIYSGNNFDRFSGTGYTRSDHVSATIDLSVPLGSDLASASVAPITFTITDGVNIFTPANTNIAQSTFSFSTDASGAITKWDVLVAADPSFIRTATPPALFIFPADIGGASTGSGFNIGNPGTWSTTIGPLTLDQQTVAQAIVQGAVHYRLAGKSDTGSPTQIGIAFDPNFGLSLQEAATLSGYVGYDWHQTVVIPGYTGLRPATATDIQPVSGGYRFTDAQAAAYPLYYDPSPSDRTDLALSNYMDGAIHCPFANRLCFFDSPQNPFYNSHPDAQRSLFKTDLVGLLPCAAPTPGCNNGYTYGPTLYELTWTSNYSGSSGSLEVAQAYPGEFSGVGGTGGITVLSESYSVPSPVAGAGIPGFLLIAGMFGWWRALRHFQVR